MLTPPKLSMSTLSVTLPVDLSELDNKETLFVKKRETNDAEVSEEVVWFLKVARELQEPRSLVLPPAEIVHVHIIHRTSFTRALAPLP